MGQCSVDGAKLNNFF